MTCVQPCMSVSHGGRGGPNIRNLGDGRTGFANCKHADLLEEILMVPQLSYFEFSIFHSRSQWSG